MPSPPSPPHRFLVPLAWVAGLAATLLAGGLLLTAGLPARAAHGWPDLALGTSLGAFTNPVGLVHAGDGSGRLFVIEQGGRIRLIKDGTVVATPFLDISSRVSTGSEQGLLGLAFPPGYASKGYFYLNYTNRAGDTVVARYRLLSGQPDRADAASEQVVLTVAQPYANHNGGDLVFGPDGFLYIGLGDGGSANDPENRAQNPATLLGKMLRIDVETGSPATYTVPPANPFVGQSNFRPEIWALGLRNPWRYSFDRQTGDLYIGDVGQAARDEIDFQPAGAGGANYGWRIYEGTGCTNLDPCAPPAGYVPPVAEYNHNSGDCSVTGGYVYRGTQFPGMAGIYFYADLCTGRIWGLRRSAGAWESQLLLDTPHVISSFGEDEAGRLYVVKYGASGAVFPLLDTTPPPPAPAPCPQGTPPGVRTPSPGAQYLPLIAGGRCG